MVDRPFSGCTALVTGASSGIGRALACSIAAKGVGRIVLVARRRDRLEALAQDLGDIATVVVADLTEPAEIDALIAAYPQVDLLVNSAGFGELELFAKSAECSPTRLVALVDLHCHALLRLTMAYVPSMLARGRGYILNVGSVAGLLPTPLSTVYGATKAFINHFTESLRIEVRGKGVHVHLLAPGPVETEFYSERDYANLWLLRPLFLPSRRVADEAIDALLADRPRHVPGLRVRLVSALSALIPLAAHRFMMGIGIRQWR